MKFLSQEMARGVVNQIILLTTLVAMCWGAIELLVHIPIVRDMIKEIATTEYSFKLPVK